MKYFLINVIIALIVLVTAAIRFYPNHVNLPEGCDEFGYLHLADAISTGKTFAQHTERPYLEELISFLEKKGYSHREMAWVIAPHAYYLEASQKKIINQYPPGTSALVAWLPKEWRQFYFPVLVFAIIYLLGFAVIYFRKPGLLQSEILTTMLLAFCVFAITSSPLLKELTNVNSVAPTLGFLLAGGMLLSSHPLIAILLIGCSVNFRLANVLLLPPLVALYTWQEGTFYWKGLGTYFKRGLLATAVVVVAGMAIYMGYAWKLLNNPLAATYSEIDQQSGMGLLPDNLRYYFSFRQPWFIMNIGLFGILCWRWRKKQLGSALFYAIAAMLTIVYAYFLTHQAKTPYYPYAPAIIMTGILFRNLAGIRSWKLKWVWAVKIAGVLALVVILADRFPVFQKAVAKDRGQQTRELQACFNAYDLVWGELKTGTVEYATGIPAMRYFWGHDRLRADIMHWMKNNGYRQVIFLDDLSLSREEIEQFLHRYSLSSRQVATGHCGEVLYIK